MPLIEFSKTEGLGNDFIIIDCQRTSLETADLAALSRRMCDRNFGVGADGVILVHPSHKADYRMQIVNCDGTEAEMCGNGIRCFARYLLDHGMGRTPLHVETAAGIKEVFMVMTEAVATGFTVNMGAPRLDAQEIPVLGYEGQVIGRRLDVDGRSFDITCVSMGNPHCVIFTDSVRSVPLAVVGPIIESHEAFPKKTNVEFVEVLNDDEINVRVWERGAGMTLACGTGACASVVAAVLNGKTGRKVTAHLPGGDLHVEWDEGGEVYMTGPAEETFTGRFRI